ncbi:Na+/H+ antiporter NhaA [Corynebacterium glucuronolyticum]|nr:Na+/H+ antiporter NhaA [Corynebacterium glucuronolyticum]
MEATNKFIDRGTYRSLSTVEDKLTTTTMTGVLLIVATIAALIFANSGLSDFYYALRSTEVERDFGFLNLRLSLGAWAADGLLAVFFFLVGLELKRQFVLAICAPPAAPSCP